MQGENMTDLNNEKEIILVHGDVFTMAWKPTKMQN